MSTRAIGAALGVDDKTVRNDMSGADYSAPVTGLDGKTYRGARHRRGAGGGTADRHAGCGRCSKWNR
ncbi:MAG: hypothetical protein IT341_09240 [Chloroflexi bacterium]|nr:hypothetical protein [Chloroflexota bacterium]